MKAKIISAVPVPFTANGDIDFSTYENLLAAIDPHVDSVLAAGTTGEFPALDDEERIKLFAATKSVLGAERTIAHLGHASLRQVIRIAEGADKLGINRFALLTPYYLPTDPKGTYEHFRTISERFPTHPLYAYLFPDRAGYEVSASELEAILRLPAVVGVKLSGGAAGKIAEYSQVVGPDQELFSGDDSTLPRVMALGGHGVVSGVSSAFPKTFAALVDALDKGDEPTIAKIQADVKEIVSMVGSPLSHLKYALAARTGATWACRMSQPAVAGDVASRIEALVATHG